MLAGIFFITRIFRRIVFIKIFNILFTKLAVGQFILSGFMKMPIIIIITVKSL